MRTFADSNSAAFQRIQFTPDLLPADLVGTVISNQPRPPACPGATDPQLAAKRVMTPAET